MAAPASHLVSSVGIGKRPVAPIHWGLLGSIAGVHAAGLLALYELGGPTPAEPPVPVVPPTMTVHLIAPETYAAPGPIPAPVPEPVVPPRRNEPVPATARPRPTPSPDPEPRPPAPAVPSAELPSSRDIAREMPVPPVVPAEQPAAASPGSVHAERSPLPLAAIAREEAPVPVTAASFDAAYLHNPAPTYPQAARRRGEEGRVVLRVHVLGDGSADAVEIAESSGHARLDAAARDTVRAWRFVPARRGDVALDSWLRVPVVFRLDDG